MYVCMYNTPFVSFDLSPSHDLSPAAPPPLPSQFRSDLTLHSFTPILIHKGLDFSIFDFRDFHCGFLDMPNFFFSQKKTLERRVSVGLSVGQNEMPAKAKELWLKYGTRIN